jgi:hypothetical protein
VVDLGAAPLRQEAAMAETAVQDLDGRIAQLDAMVDAATSRGRSKTAMGLVQDQSHSRAGLDTQREAAKARLAALHLQQAALDAQRQRISAEVGPAL